MTGREARARDWGRWAKLAARSLLALVALAGFCVLIWIHATPSPEAVCARLLRHATLAGELVNEDDRDTCEREYKGRREALGAIAWGRVSRCIQRSQTIAGAGGCVE